MPLELVPIDLICTNHMTRSRTALRVSKYQMVKSPNTFENSSLGLNLCLNSWKREFNMVSAFFCVDTNCYWTFAMFTEYCEEP